MGTETDLSEIAGLDDVADLLREAAVEAIGDMALLLVEKDDDWFAVVRVDGEEDPRVFLSDPRAVLTSEWAELLYQDIGQTETVHNGDPTGDTDLLDDLGTAPDRLLQLSESALPSDALSAVAERAGFPEVYDQLRVIQP